MQIRNLLNTNILAILFFIIIFLLGISLFQDYGISLDEPFHRPNALFWYEYVKGFILDPGISITDNLENLIKQDTYVKVKKISNSSIPSIQPVPLAIFCELFIDLFNIEGSKNIFQFRHLFNFFIYFLGLYYFYRLINKRYKSYLYSLVGVLFLFLTPRFFAESFYNQQDIFFLSLTVINIYTGINFLKRPSIKSTLTFSLSSALVVDTRIMGVISASIIFFLFVIKSLRSNIFLKRNLKYIFYYVPCTLFLIIFFWPYLWSDPINNFLFAFSDLSTAAFNVTNFYLGKFILSTNIPWHYHIVWIGITTPLIIIFLFLFGAFFLFRRIFIRFINLNDNYNDIWRGDNEMFDICFLMMILLPIIIFIKKSLGYSGWRHLYFIYPWIIMIALSGFYYLHFSIKQKIIKVFIYFLIIINLVYLTYWNYKFHPHQYVYFNLMFKKNFHNNFDMDYWGLSNKSALEYIINNNTDYPIKIGTKSFASLSKSSLILNDKDKTKITIVSNLEEADFIITNYITRIKNDYVIDKSKYKKYYEVLVDNKAINTVYKKN